jgi:uncharacterized protein (DUF433 family)
MAMDNSVINIDPELMSGTPVFSGTRVPIQSLFDYLETGETIDQFVEDFPTVEKSQVISLLELANKITLQTATFLLNENLTR